MTLVEMDVPGLLVVLRDAFVPWDSMSQGERREWLGLHRTNRDVVNACLPAEYDERTVVPAPDRAYQATGGVPRLRCDLCERWTDRDKLAPMYAGGACLYCPSCRS